MPLPLFTAGKESLLKKNTRISDKVKALCDLQLMTLLARVWPEGAGADITVNIISRRAAALNIKQDGTKVVIDAHWNLFIPYFYQIEELPIVHPEVLDIFAEAVFSYAAVAMRHPEATRKELRNLVIEAYSDEPQFLLASLDIFNKPSIYHIHPARIWFTGFSAANDDRRLEIDDRASTTLPVSPDFLEEVSAFVHQVAKNYAFRYVDYLWTQRYRISCAERPDMNMVAREGNDIVINMRPLIGQAGWKPALYLSLGYAIMLAILESSGGRNNDENIYLAIKKTWDRYASLDEYPERQSVRLFCGLSELTNRGHTRRLLECLTGKEVAGLMDDFMMFMDYSGKETLAERLKALRESQHEGATGVDYEQLSDAVRNLKMTLRRNNIGYSKLIAVLRDDNIDHQQLADLLLTGFLHNRRVVDVNEWLLLRTLLYDLINAPKVFKNDYKMLLKVITKVNKGLIIYIWTLILNNDERCELVNGYIAKLITDIFVFDRVKVYEIASEPVECLEAEAVTGYLLNWAGLSLEEWRSIVGGALSRMPRALLAGLSVRTGSDVDQLIRAMTVRSSGLIGFYLHQAYRWGSTDDELTGRIRSYFPELLNLAQKAMIPGKTIFGGAMLLLILAQIISDQHDGFAGNVEISQGDRQIVLSLIEQCVDWNQSHFVIMVGGIAAGYTGSIDGWTLQRFDALLGRYGGGDRVVLRSVVQFDVEILIERTLITARAGEESALVNKIQMLRLMVDPVISNRANKFLADIAARHDIKSPEDALKKRDVRDLVVDLSRRMKTKLSCMEEGDRT